MKRVQAILVLLIGAGAICVASGMDRWSALSMLESGNNDQAIGPLGEVSRFQIRPHLWPGGNPQDMQIALSAAQKIMQQRIEAFQKTHNRPPTDFEFYVLWNAPVQMDHPSRTVTNRAKRFENLVRRESSDLASH